MMRLFRFARKEEETSVALYTRCCRTAKKIWAHMSLPFLNEIIAEKSMACHGLDVRKRYQPSHLFLKKTLKWRSSIGGIIQKPEE